MQNFAEASVIVEFVAILLVFGTADFLFFYHFKTKWGIVLASVLEVSAFLSWLFNLIYLFIVLTLLAVVSLGTYVIVNAADIKEMVRKRRTLWASLNKKAKKKKISKKEHLFDRDAMYAEVVDAVKIMSRKRCGALITFEKTDDLTSIMSNGTIINCPVTSEIIQTIFYEGTRLHDGAIVIRDNTIVAASVYFPSTSRPLTGKYGARHRAAYGISETTDAVTIIVSEETGRIQIGYHSDLTSVEPDALLTAIEESMKM